MLLCNSSTCVGDMDEDALTCAKCKRSVHYRCTMLPAYQIQVFLAKQYIKYYCQNCVTVPDRLLVLVPNRDRSIPSTANEIKRLKREVHGCEGIIKSHEDYENHLKSELIKKEEDLTQLKKSLQNNPGLHTVEYVENKFEKQLEVFKESILSSIKTECEGIEHKINEKFGKSYATALGNPTDSKTSPNASNSKSSLKDAIRSAKIEEKPEYDEKRHRPKNILFIVLKTQLMMKPGLAV